MHGQPVEPLGQQVEPPARDHRNRIGLVDGVPKQERRKIVELAHPIDVLQLGELPELRNFQRPGFEPQAGRGQLHFLALYPVPLRLLLAGGIEQLGHSRRRRRLIDCGLGSGHKRVRPSIPKSSQFSGKRAAAEIKRRKGCETL